MTIKKRIKVFHIIESLEVGGAQQIILEIAKNIDKERFETVVCSLSDKDALAQDLRSEGVKVILFKQKNNYDISILPGLIKILKAEKPEIVNTWLFGADFWGRLAAILAGVPVKLSSVVSVYKVYKWKNHFVDRLLEPFTDKFIFCNDTAIEYMKAKSGISPGKVVKITEPVDLGMYYDAKTKVSGQDKHNFRRRFSLRDDLPTISIIARLEEQKGIEYFIESASILDKQMSAQYLIVGEGSLRKHLEDRVKDLKINSTVVFTGLERNLQLILSLSDVLVISSVWEGKPLVMLNAMAAGVPVVGFAIDGVKEVLTADHTGFPCKPQDKISLAENIKRAITEKELVNIIAANARSYIRNNYGSAHVVKEYENIYDSLLEGR
jgi:glycosyltransferase involved in cell wall biosynthesis